MTQTIRDLMTGDGKIEKGSGYNKKRQFIRELPFFIMSVNRKIQKVARYAKIIYYTEINGTEM